VRLRLRKLRSILGLSISARREKCSKRGTMRSTAVLLGRSDGWVCERTAAFVLLMGLTAARAAANATGSRRAVTEVFGK
jgi:hypothetical protein